MIVYAVGGRQRRDALTRPTWAHFDRAVIVRIDLESGERSVCFEYAGPPVQGGDAVGSHTFGAATWTSDRIYACTKTEVLVLSRPEFHCLHRLSLPCFNDLHHVRPTAHGTLLVVVTGLDMVVECTLDGSIRNVWNVVDERSPWDRFSRDIDYRHVPSTKPHRSHPNYVFEWNGEVWVTRFEQRDAICLDDRGRRMVIGIERPHDGIVTSNGVWFTTVDGHLLRIDPDSCRVGPVWDVTGGGIRRPGWCRGLAVHGDRAVVGFSRLRWTQWPADLSWLRGGVKALRTLAHRGARLAQVDLGSGKILRHIDLSGLPISAVFSVHMDFV